MHTLENSAGARRRIRVSLFVALALVLASHLPGASGDALAATAEQCTTEFNESPASSNGCTLQSATPSGNSDCTIEANCSYSIPSVTSGTTSNTITVPLDDVDDLQNCSAGVLELTCSAASLAPGTRWASLSGRQARQTAPCHARAGS